MNKARIKLKPLWDLLNVPNLLKQIVNLLTKCNLSIDNYNNYDKALPVSNMILSRRDPNKAVVNGYNPYLLRAWNANMHIQYILDSYSCTMSMLSYISKPAH